MRFWLLTFFVSLLPIQYTCAQDWEWVQTAGSEDQVNVGSAVCTDVRGNIYVTGFIHRPVRFQEEVNSGRTFHLSSNIKRDDHMFIARYNSAGRLMWVNYATGRYAEGKAICTDSYGNVYVTGRFSERTMFSSTDGNNSRMEGSSPGMMFIAKYDAGGRLKWVVKGGTPHGQNSGEAISVSNDRVYVAGYSEIEAGEAVVYRSSDYSKRIFHPVAGQIQDYTTVGSIVAYDLNGRFKQATFLGSATSKVHFHDLKVNKRHMFVSATVRGAYHGYDIHLDGNNFQPEGLVLQFDVGGRYSWHSRISARFSPSSQPRLALSGHRLGVGFACIGGASLYDSRKHSKVLKASSPQERFINVSLMDHKGNFLWHAPSPVPEGGTGTHDLDFDRSGNLYLTGHISEDTWLGNHKVSTKGFQQPSNPEEGSWWDKNLFIAKINSRGEYLWAESSSGNRYEISYGLALDPSRNVFVTGYFNGGQQVSFGQARVREFGQINIFLAKLNPAFRKTDRRNRPALARLNRNSSQADGPRLPHASYAESAYDSPNKGELAMGREVIKQQQITVKGTEIDVYLWDNNRIDGDVVSLYLNDECVLKSYQLRSHTKHVHLSLPEGVENQLMIYADNVGMITPNTTAVTIYDGHTTQRVHLLSDYQRSESLTIMVGKNGAR
ncbi:MAG: hypothetical protein AAGI38_09260 [Bacteroidota bacterium]